ncbi:MAG: RNA methyltransferase [Elusimicrobia bacterium]|nr:RNA methyltransferase [Elusimicrobiota bacterium]
MRPARLRIILVRPRDPNNIGAAARAMANFGLTDLRVVAPHPPVWREAKSAVGAEGLLRAATEAAAIEEAVAGCRTVWATSALKARRAEVPVIDLPEARWPSGEVAVLFGPEKTGLTAEDLAFASAVLRVPTSVRQPSMNLAASVGVVAYEWSRAGLRAAPVEGPAAADAALKSRLWGLVESLAKAAGWPEGTRTRRLKAAVFRSNLTAADAGMALELLRRLSRR